MTPEQRTAFLTELAKDGNARRACTDSGVSKSAVYRLRESSAEFRAEFDDACEQAGSSIEREIYRRGVEGFVETRKDGGQTRAIQRFSDQCLLALAAARNPAFAKRREHKHVHEGTIQHEHRHHGIDSLTPEQRRHLRAILDLGRLREGKLVPAERGRIEDSLASFGHVVDVEHTEHTEGQQ